MTHEEFEACKLAKRLTFRESEAARQVLVLGMTIESAAYCCVLDTKEGIAKIEAAIELFTEAYLNFRTK